MKGTMKLAIYCTVLGATLSYVCALQSALDKSEACLVQYLKRKAKLTNDFPSTIQPSPKCRLVMPLTLQIIRETLVDEIKEKVPNDSECLIKELDNQETVDQVIKISVIHESRSLSENEVTTQLEAARNQLKRDLENIAIQCNTVDERFTQIFNEYLGIKNETLEVLQYEYCIAKYIADNSFLPLDNVELNPHHIDISKVNCNNIIDKDRKESIEKLRNKIISNSIDEHSSECVLNAYKRDNIFEWGLALKVLSIVELPKETMESGKLRVTQNIGSFGGTTTACILSNAI